MPEQLTKHPEVTLEVLRSAGAQCGAGAAQQILTSCPADRFCKLPGGELCVYGLADATKMTQITGAEWRSLVPPVPAAPARQPEAADWLIGAAALVAGLTIGFVVSHLRRRHR